MPVTLRLSVELSDDSRCSTIWLAKSKGKWRAWLVDTTDRQLDTPADAVVIVQDAVASPADVEAVRGGPVSAGPLTLC